jgi:hypothetical protein
MGYQDRYASAIRSSCLTVDERTRMSDSDVLGAAGLAAKSHPLALALLRLFMGDNFASVRVTEILAEMAWAKARYFKARVSRGDSELIAQACLAWHRDGTCKHCGGHGLLTIPGTKTLGHRSCQPCAGTGMLPFERQFSVAEVRELARWLVSELDREHGRATQAASRCLGYVEETPV